MLVAAVAMVSCAGNNSKKSSACKAECEQCVEAAQCPTKACAGEAKCEKACCGEAKCEKSCEKACCGDAKCEKSCDKACDKACGEKKCNKSADCCAK